MKEQKLVERRADRDVWTDGKQLFTIRYWLDEWAHCPEDNSLSDRWSKTTEPGCLMALFEGERKKPSKTSLITRHILGVSITGQSCKFLFRVRVNLCLPMTCKVILRVLSFRSGTIEVSSIMRPWRCITASLVLEVLRSSLSLETSGTD